MSRWKFVTLASAIIVTLSVGGAIITARYFPSAHTVDFAPLGPILIGLVALLILWIGAYGSWLVETLRKPPGDREDSARPVG